MTRTTLTASTATASVRTDDADLRDDVDGGASGELAGRTAVAALGAGRWLIGSVVGRLLGTSGCADGSVGASGAPRVTSSTWLGNRRPSGSVVFDRRTSMIVGAGAGCRSPRGTDVFDETAAASASASSATEGKRFARSFSRQRAMTSSSAFGTSARSEDARGGVSARIRARSPWIDVPENGGTPVRSLKSEAPMPQMSARASTDAGVRICSGDM